MDIIPALFFGGIIAFVGGMLGAIGGWRLSDTLRYSKKTERIIYLVIGLSGGAVAGGLWLLAWLVRH
jgi:hypothetical protein